MQRHGRVSGRDHDNVGLSLTSLRISRHSPDVTADCLREFCIGLGPYLKATSSADADADMRDDGNPRTWAPARLSTERVTFQSTDARASTEIHGPYRVEIRAGLRAPWL